MYLCIYICILSHRKGLISYGSTEKEGGGAPKLIPDTGPLFDLTGPSSLEALNCDFHSKPFKVQKENITWKISIYFFSDTHSKSPAIKVVGDWSIIQPTTCYLIACECHIYIYMTFFICQRRWLITSRLILFN